MDVLSSLSASGILGGLFGAIGSGLGRLVGIYEMRERRQDRTLEMTHEKALWAHELDLQNLQARARAVESENALRIGEQTLQTLEVQGAWQGLKTSLEAEGALRASHPAAHTPARAAAIVTPSDTVDLSPYAKALKCNTAGHLYVLPVANYQAGSTAPVKLVVAAGEYVPVQVARVFATNTTVTDIVALSQ